MTATEDYALIDEYEGFDEYEGSFDYYTCHNCGAFLTTSIGIQILGDAIPRTCPNCGKELRWSYECH